MGQSLVVAAGCGQSTESISGRKQRLLSEGRIEDLLALSASLFGATRMDAGDDGDDDADDADSADDKDDSDDDEDGDDADEDPKDVRIQELSTEAKKKRLRIRAQAQRIAALEAENAQLKSKGTSQTGDDKSDDKKDNAGPNPLEKENQELKERLARQSLQTEFNRLITGPKAKVKFKNPATAFKLIDLDEVDIDEDGKIDGLQDAISALAKSDPYLLDKGEDDDDEGRPRRVGQPTGSRSKPNPNREKLLKKYPALRR